MNLSTSFAKGLLLGLATAGAAFLAIEAIRRARTPSLADTQNRFRIDGVRPLDPVIDMQPNPDGGGERHTLASEIPDVPPLSQRW